MVMINYIADFELRNEQFYYTGMIIIDFTYNRKCKQSITYIFLRNEPIFKEKLFHYHFLLY